MSVSVRPASVSHCALPFVLVCVSVLPAPVGAQEGFNKATKALCPSWHVQPPALQGQLAGMLDAVASTCFTMYPGQCTAAAQVPPTVNILRLRWLSATLPSPAGYCSSRAAQPGRIDPITPVSTNSKCSPCHLFDNPVHCFTHIQLCLHTFTHR